jgi:hypothetical protein
VLCISDSLELVLWYCNNFYSNSVLFEIRNVVTSLLGLVIVSHLSPKGSGSFTYQGNKRGEEFHDDRRTGGGRQWVVAGLWSHAQSEREGEGVRLRAQVIEGRWESRARGSKGAWVRGRGRRTRGRGRVHGGGSWAGGWG